MDMFIGFCIGVYLMGLVIHLGLKVMGSEKSLPGIFLWPISWLFK